MNRIDQLIKLWGQARLILSDELLAKLKGYFFDELRLTDDEKAELQRQLVDLYMREAQAIANSAPLPAPPPAEG